MTAKAKKRIEFKSIPCSSDSGYIALSIYPPGTWMDDKDYVCFVGGCGIGHAQTLRQAKAILLQGAKRHLLAYVKEARARITHYESQLAELNDKGLQR